MLSEENKKEIRQRLEIENMIRMELAEETANSPKSFWAFFESKLGILIIASLLSGILIPLFQFTQESIKWSRQNRYDNLQYRLKMVRNSMNEMTLVHAFNAEAYERSHLLLFGTTTDSKALSGYKKGMEQMNHRRFRQNATFVSTLIHFPDEKRKQIKNAFQLYLSSSQAFINLLQETALSKEAPHVDNWERTVNTSLASLQKTLNRYYLEIIDHISQQLGVLENESERYM